MCCPNGVLDLTAVDVALSKLLQPVINRLCTSLEKKRPPNLNFGGLRQPFEVQGYVNPRQECGIKCLDAVSGQEEDAGVVFNVSQTVVEGGRSARDGNSCKMTHKTATIAFRS